MLERSSAAAVAVALVAALTMTIDRAQAADGANYPDWKGKWERFVVRGLPGQPSHDQTKPWGFGQQAPLTPEYQGGSGGEHRRPGQRRAGQFPHHLRAPRRHAEHDDGIRAAGIRRHAAHHLYPDRLA